MRFIEDLSVDYSRRPDTCAVDLTVCNDLGACGAVVNYVVPDLSGGCPDVATACSPPSGSFFPVGTTTVNCLATNLAGGIVGQCFLQVTVNDCEPPVITGSGTTLTPGCNPGAATIDAALGTATATDNCGNVTPAATDTDITITGCTRSQTRTWMLTDAGGNAATPVSRTVTWTEDLTAPVITASGTTLTLGCNPTTAAIEAALGTATATDNCGNVTPAATDTDITITGCSRSQTRTWTLTDACGNAATPVSRTVTWTVDTTAPAITASGTTLTLGCNPSAAVIEAALGTATATDNCGNVTPTPADSVITPTGCTRSQTRTWNLTRRLRQRCHPGVPHRTWTVDLTAPVITASGTTLTLGCNPSATAIEAALGTATATDNCGNVTPTAADSVVTSTGCTRSQTRTWTLTDACGNIATPAARTVTWTVDLTAPVITGLPAGVSLGCNPATVSLPTDADVKAQVTATDNCSLASTNVTHVDGGTACASNRTFTITVTDACGSVVVTNVVYTWTTDTTPPVIVCPTNIVVVYSCTNIAVSYPVTATDTCCSNVDLVFTPTNHSVFAIGTTTNVHCVATDCCGNTNSCDFTVTVQCVTNTSMSVMVPVVGNTFVIWGEGYIPNYPFTVLTSTNIAADITNWTSTGTHLFDDHGRFSVTNTIVPSESFRFYILKYPP